MNSSVLGSQSQSPSSLITYSRYLAISSAFCLTVLSVVTTTSNILLLVAIWKDPLKCFKSSAKYFILGLSMADLITGLTTEPFFATFYFSQFFKNTLTPPPIPSLLYKIGGIISGVALKYSFLVVLALSWSQLTAISFPHQYRKFITTRNIAIFLVLAFLYLVLFTAVQFMGILDLLTFHKIDLACNSTFLSINLLIVSILLYCAYKRRTSVRESTREPLNSTKRPKTERKGREKNLDHQFTIVSIYLGAILLLCALPHVISVYIFLYTEQMSQPFYLNLLISLRISDILLFVKVCVDPFIYAWRLPTYRKTLKKLFQPRTHSNRNEEQRRLVGLANLVTEPKTTSSPINTNGHF